MMRKALLYVVLLYITALYGQIAARADNSDIFTIENVEASATADNLDEAKYQAQDNGMQEAARQLLLRMLPRNLYPRVPQILRNFDRSEWVDSYHVINERMTSTSYQASFTIRFAPNKVQTAIVKQGVRFGKKWADPILLIPKVLNIDESDWFAAWGRAPTTFGLSRIVVPLDDLEDLELTGEGNDPHKQYLRLMQKYNCGALAIVQLTQQSSGAQVSYNKFSQEAKIQHIANYKMGVEQDNKEFYDAVVDDLQTKIDAEQKGVNLW